MDEPAQLISQLQLSRRTGTQACCQAEQLQEMKRASDSNKLTLRSAAPRRC